MKLLPVVAFMLFFGSPAYASSPLSGNCAGVDDNTPIKALLAKGCEINAEVLKKFIPRSSNRPRFFVRGVEISRKEYHDLPHDAYALQVWSRSYGNSNTRVGDVFTLSSKRGVVSALAYVTFGFEFQLYSSRGPLNYQDTLGSFNKAAEGILKLTVVSIPEFDIAL